MGRAVCSQTHSLKGWSRVMSAKSNSQIQIAQPVRTRSSHDLHMWVKTNQLDMSITVICACCARMRWSKSELTFALCSTHLNGTTWT